MTSHIDELLVRSKILRQHPIKTLAGWYCRINCHDWPQELGPAPPEREGSFHDYVAVMSEIEQHIGRRICSREWNKDSMNDEQHAAWWELNGH